MSNLVVEFKKRVNELVKLMDKTDLKSKELFSLSQKLLKESVSIKEGVKALNDIVETIGTHDAFKKRITRVIKVASIAVENKLMVNSEELYFYNIERATKLLEHLNEYFTEDVTKVKNLLNKLKGKIKKDRNFITKYNNLYNTTLDELYKTYKIEEDESKTFSKVGKLIQKLSLDRKKELLAELQAQIGGE